MNGYLPGVTMTLTNTQSGAKHEIRSDRSGHFEFVGLPPGAYSLEALLPGFSVLRGALDLTGRDVQRDVTLKIGQLEETISVWASSPSGARTPPANQPPRPRPDTNTMMQACAQNTPKTGTMGGNLKQPMKLVDKKPNYPEQLAADLELAAATAIRQWEFSPTLLNCVAVEVPMKVTVTFRAE